MAAGDKLYYVMKGLAMLRFRHFTYHSLSRSVRGGEPSDFIRDVGVAGSNPVTPTTDLIEENIYALLRGAIPFLPGVPSGCQLSTPHDPTVSRLFLLAR
jgi:hypothetical protein